MGTQTRTRNASRAAKSAVVGAQDLNRRIAVPHRWVLVQTSGLLTAAVPIRASLHAQITQSRTVSSRPRPRRKVNADRAMKSAPIWNAVDLVRAAAKVACAPTTKCQQLGRIKAATRAWRNAQITSTRMGGLAARVKSATCNAGRALVPDSPIAAELQNLRVNVPMRGMTE